VLLWQGFCGIPQFLEAIADNVFLKPFSLPSKVFIIYNMQPPYNSTLHKVGSWCNLWIIQDVSLIRKYHLILPTDGFGVINLWTPYELDIKMRERVREREREFFCLGCCSSSVIGQYLIRLQFNHTYQFLHQHLLIKMLMNFTALGGLWVSHRLLVVKSVPRHGRLQAIFCLILLHSITFIDVLFPLEFWLISLQLCLFVISTTTHQMIWSGSGTDLLFMWCMKWKRNERRGRVYLFVLLPSIFTNLHFCGPDREVVRWLLFVFVSAY
jgi:hypothetical protein